MKHSIIIQRLCLFLFALVLAAPAWSYSITVKARDRSAGEVEGKRDVMSDGYIVARWSDCKTGPALLAANRNWKMKKGSTVTISCFGRWRFRGIRFREQLKNADKLICISDNRYTGDPTSNSGLSCYDAPNTKVTLQANDDIEFAEYIIEFVAEPRVSFKKKEYTFFVGDQFHLFYDNMVENPYEEFPKFELSTEEPGMLNKETAWDFFTVIKAGKTNLVFRAVPDDRYAAGSIKVPFEVTRRTMDAYLDGPKTVRLQVWDNLSLPVLKRIPEDYDRSKITRKISDEKVVKIEGEKIKLGSDPFGKTATITYTLPEDHKYKTKTLTLTIIVPKEAEISSQDDWKKFCAAVNSGWNNADAKLMKDVNLGGDIAMVGNRYSGTFDGQNHTLTLGWDGGDGWMAPFHTMNGATIKNLRVNGYIKSKGKGLSGLILNVYGNTTVLGCTSEVDITSGSSDGGCASAGMIQYISSDAHVSINDCLVKGTLKATTEIGTKGMAGFVYDQRGNCTLTNCLYTGTNNAAGGYTFAYKSTIKNCYYLNACAATYGTRVTIDQLKSGEVAYKLQAGRDTQMWGQTLGTDNEPLPTGNGTKRVHKVDFTYNNQVNATRYATHDNAIYGSLPATAKEIMGSDYNEHHYYTGISFEGFSASTTVNSDRTVRVIINKNDYYAIASKENWKEFCNIVNGGQTKLDAKMTADVDLGDEIVMAGSRKNYSGIFDGGEHTLTLNWNAGSGHWKSPFYTVENATIKNLRVKGYIKSKGKGHTGLIQNAYGTVTVSGCVSDVDITCIDNGDECSAAGMIQWVGSDVKVNFNDCLVKGSINATTEKGTKGMAGFVYDQKGTCTLTNCLYAGTNNATTGSNTFAKNATLTNCYYLNACGTAQGKQVTKDQLKNGDVARLLQSNRNTQFWGQELGKENEPLPTAEGAKKVYNIDFAYKGKVKASRYANPGKAIFGGMPTFIAKDIMDSEYNEHHYYTFAFGNNFNASVLIYYDRTVDINPTENDYYAIASKADWKEFCDIVSNGQNAIDAKMTADVNLGSDIMMAGTGEHKYSGTFDGQGHTLTLNWDGKQTNSIAPFLHVRGANIRNLRTKGQILALGYELSGLIAQAFGTTTLTNCVSDVNIAGGSQIAGMISWIEFNAHVTFTDCIVKGSLTATNEDGRSFISGFVFFPAETATYKFENCLYLGTSNATNKCYTFCKNADLKNCYYLNTCGTAQGMMVTEDQLKNGEVTYLLQNKRDANIWGQELGKENEPMLTDIAAKHIYKVDFTYNGKVAAARYANRGKHIFGELPKEKEILGAAYDPNNTYALAFEDDFSASTTVDRDRTVVVTVIENNYFEIATKEDWKKFCGLVKKGQQNLNAKMTKDVDLGTEIIMAGEENLEYSGTFDGQGHTLKFDWDGGYTAWISPFLHVKDATIKNLRTKGQITAGRFGFSGLICQAYGNNTISSCVSDVDINGADDLAGMVKTVKDNSSVTFTDCVVKGTLHVTYDDCSQDMGGFVYYQSDNATCTFNSCLYLGTNNATGWAKTFAPNPTLNNCYYLNLCGKEQGMKVTEEQLKNGYVAHKLQADRTDKCYWAQQLGDMLDFYNAADKGKTNYVYYDATNNRWTCDDFRLTDGTPLSIGLDFTAAKATYDRAITTEKVTVCLPYELPVTGFKAYTLSGGNNSAVHFADAKDKLEAYKPYLIASNGTPQLDGNNIEVKAFNAAALTSPAGKYKFVGTVTGMDNATAAAANAYILQDDGLFHKVTTEHSAAMLPAYRAYIVRNDGSGAKQLSVVLDGETTGIDGMTDDAMGTDGTVYDLHGRRMADRLDDNTRRQLPAGVYIVSGRKVILK